MSVCVCVRCVQRRRLLHRIEVGLTQSPAPTSLAYPLCVCVVCVQYTEKSKQEAAAKLKAKRAAIDKASRGQTAHKHTNKTAAKE